MRETADKSGPSNNWMQLQKKLKPKRPTRGIHSDEPPHKRRRIQHDSSEVEIARQSSSSFPRGSELEQPVASSSAVTPVRYSPKDDSIQALRHLIEGAYEYSPAQMEPGKFLAIDCEMVGVGLDAKESALARVSIVNYHGALQMDEFVRPKERVVDYRTEFSGIRPKDLVKAKSFEEIQKQVADLIKDRILVGHAIHNDLKALLLSHPRQLVRDTQQMAGKHKLTKSRRPALRHIVQQEFGMAIQAGEHSSVVDARATMAIYRLHRKVWEKGMPSPHSGLSAAAGGKRKRSASDHDGQVTEALDEEIPDDDDDHESTSGYIATKKTAAKKITKTHPKEYPGGGRKGVSSGLSTVIKRNESKPGNSWWKELG